MLQLQYLNRGLKNKHINHILDNYKIKYSGIKMEIESKVNDMINLILKDILGFLENIEETAKNKKKLNNYEKMKTELESIKNQLKIKTYNEYKTKNELDLLIQENSLLKVKIKSLNQKILNLNNNLSNSNIGNNHIKSKSPFVRHTLKSNLLMTPNLNFKYLNNSTKALINYSKKLNNNHKVKTYRNSCKKLEYTKGSKIANTSCILSSDEKSPLKKDKSEIINLKINSQKTNDGINKIKKKKPKNLNKFVNSKNNNNLNNRNSSKNLDNSNNNTKTETKNFITCSPRLISSPISNIMINEKKERSSSSKSNHSNRKEKIDTHNYSPDNSFDLLPCLNQDYEEIEKDINKIFDEELRQLDQDEENIKNLLEQINSEDLNNLILNKQSGDSKFSVSD